MHPHIEVSGSLGTNPQLGLWRPVTSMNMKKEPGPTSRAEVSYVPGFWGLFCGKSGWKAAATRQRAAGLADSSPPASLRAPQGRLRTSGGWPCGHVAGRRHVLWEKESRMVHAGSAHMSGLPSSETRALAVLEGADSLEHVWTSPKPKLIVGCGQQLRRICGSLSPGFTFLSLKPVPGGTRSDCNTCCYSFQTEQTLFNSDQGQDVVRSVCEGWLLQGSKFAK